MNITFDNEEQYKRMTGTPVPKLVASLFLPTVASTLVTTIYNAADTFFVAKIGTSAAAAVGVVFSLMSIIQAFGFGVGMGTGSLTSRLLGKKENTEAERVASSALFAAVLFGLALTVTGLCTLEGLMRLLGSTETMLPYACDYARYILIGAPLMCPSFVLNNILRSEGEAIFSMVGLCIGGVINIILDPIFIFVLDMGIAGAAAATLLSQCVSFSILLSFFIRGKSIIKPSPRLISRDISTYALILKTGFPTICRQGMASIASALLNIRASVYGDAAVAAITITNKIYLFVRNIVIGVGQGFQPVAGYNYGAGKKSRVKEAFRFALLVGTCLCTLMAVVIAIYAKNVIGWFRDSDAQVIEIGTVALRFACCVMPLMAYSTYVNQLHQSLGFNTQATFLACCRQGVFFIPLILLLPELFGLTGVQLAQPLADFLSFCIAVPFQVVFFNRHLGTPKDGTAGQDV